MIIHSQFTKQIPADLRKLKLFPLLAAVCRQSQTHWTIALTAILGAMNKPVGASVNYKNRSSSSPSTLYLLCSGQYSDGKTTAYKLVNRGTDNYRNNLLKKYFVEKSDYENKCEEYEINKKFGNKNNIKKPNKAPIYPYFSTKKCTTAGIYRVLSEGYPHLSFSTTEASSLFGGHIYRTENRLDMGSSLSTLYDGDGLDNLRKEGDVKTCDNTRFSIDAFCQPKLMTPFLRDPLLKEQGILGRFLILESEDMLQYKQYLPADYSNDKQSVADMQLIDNFNNKIEWLWKKIKYKDDDPSLGTVYREVKINVAAGNELISNFFTHTQAVKDKSHIYSEINDFYLRGLEHISRLATTLSQYYDLSSTEVSKEDIIEAIYLFNHYAKHNYKMRVGEKKLTSNVSDSPLVKFKTFMLKKKEQDRDRFTGRELQRGVRSLASREQLNSFLTILYDLDLIVKKDNYYELLKPVQEISIIQKAPKKVEYPYFDAALLIETGGENYVESIMDNDYSLIKENAYVNNDLDNKIKLLPRPYQPYFTSMINLYKAIDYGSKQDFVTLSNLHYFLSELGRENLETIDQDYLLKCVYTPDVLEGFLNNEPNNIKYINTIESTSITYIDNQDNIWRYLPPARAG